jgi:hypothetical protein
MKKIAQCTILLMAPTLVAGMALASTTASTHQSAAATQTATTPSHAKAQRVHKNSPMPLAAPEDLSGTIKAVNSGVLTVIGNNGVPYDFHVNRGTRIVMQNQPGQKLTPAALERDVRDQASIHFVPMSNGNLAKTIEIRAS